MYMSNRLCNLSEMPSTLGIIRFSEQHARRVAEKNGPVYRRHVGLTVPHVPLELVHVVRTLTAPTRVLAVYGIHAQSARSNTQQQRVLISQS